MARLGDVFPLIRNGASIKQIDGAGGLPVTRIETIANRVVDRSRMGYANIIDKDRYTEYQLQDGDILMSHINSERHLGKVARYKSIANEYIIHGMNLLVLRVNRQIMMSEYAEYFFNSDSFLRQIPNITKKSVNQASFNISSLRELFIPIPQLDQQREVVYILDEVCALISLRKQQLAKLDELVKSRFVEMFGLPGTDAHGWGISSLGEICEINPKKSQDARLTNGLLVSFVPMPSVSESGDIDTTQVKPYDEVKTGFTYFAENDVLFAKITPCMENGKGAVATGLYNGIGFGSTEFHVLRPAKETAIPCWIYTLTVFPQFRIDAASNMTGSAGQRRVPASFLENYRVSVPPLELQNRFAAFVAEVDKSKLSVQQSITQLETLKKSLMQKYFG